MGQSDTISSSVGQGGTNRYNDVLLVQRLINVKLPIPLRPLSEDGACGQHTIFAITEVQKRYLHLVHPSGRVDPGSETWKYLTVRAARKHGSSVQIPAGVISAAQAAEKAWNIPAAVTIAQWALESNWGRSMPAGSNNPFGIKAAGNQPYVEAATKEFEGGKWITIQAKFRKFDTLDDAFDQHGQLLATAKPYANARKHQDDPDAFADALTGVYATDPDYGGKLKRTMKAHNLYQYDSTTDGQPIRLP
jgi:hypothetical protein